MAIVEAKDLMKRYGSQVVLDHVTIDIQKGEIVGLVGPNGAGKTTFIHSLVGLIGTDSGEIKVFGKKFKNASNEIKSDLGLVTQELTIFDDLTARENLQFFGGLYGLKGSELKENVERVLEIVGLVDYAKKRPSTFSGGMKRRLNIACALVHQPKFVIMDEPTVGIDPQSRNHIQETVKTLQKQGTTILYTTHYMEELQSIASRIVIMDLGHVIAEGTVKELIRTIQHEEKIFLEMPHATRDFIDEVKSINGVKNVLQDEDELTIVSNVDAQNLNTILKAADRYGGVKSINSEKPKLEDVFLTLTGKTLRDGGDEADDD